MKLDDKNNIIEVCLFESHLAKYFIEHPEIFKPLINKVLEAAEHVITINSESRMFNRLLFSVFSTVAEEYPDIDDMEDLKKSDSLVVFDTFFKYFTERVISFSTTNLPERKLQKSIQTTSLGVLAQQSLFKSQEYAQDMLLDKMRPSDLFSDEHRGIIEVDIIDDEEQTTNLGILSFTDTPAELTNYFSLPHFPARQYYTPKEDSLMAQWLRERYLPVISGASGGIGNTVSKINSLIKLSNKEYQLLGLLVASSTIALGHHSFFEVLRPLSFFLGNLEDKSNLLEFYEQVIPEDIKHSPSYIAHIKSDNGMKLIEEFVFQQETMALK